MTSDLAYHVEFAGRDERDLSRQGVRLSRTRAGRCGAEFPEYTSLAPTVVEDVRHVTAVEGTQLTLVCRLNKEVAEARLVEADDEIAEFAAGRGREERVPRQLDAGRSRSDSNCSWSIATVATNRLPAEIVVNVTPNRPPKIALERPAGTSTYRRSKSCNLKAKVTDDFGVERYGVSYALGGDEPQEIDVAPDAKLAAATRPNDAKPPTAGSQQALTMSSISNRSRPSRTSWSRISSGPRTSAPTASRGGR